MPNNAALKPIRRDPGTPWFGVDRQRLTSRQPLLTRPDGRWFFAGLLVAATLLPLLVVPGNPLDPLLAWPPAWPTSWPTIWPTIWPSLWPFTWPSSSAVLLPFLCVMACGLLWGAGVQLVERPRRAQQLATMALCCTAFLGLTTLRASPATSLLSGAVALLFLFVLTQLPRRAPQCSRAAALAAQARGAAVLTLAVVLLALLRSPELTTTKRLSLLWSGGYTLALGVRWALTLRTTHRLRAAAMGAQVLLTLGLLAVAGGPWGAPSLALLYSLSVPALSTLLLVPDPTPTLRPLWELIAGHPERLLVATFMLLSVLGTGLLSLPQSTASGQALHILDAMFTAVSAVCVTGLIVLDTATAFSDLGQVILLMLIQVGGLGIMTFSTATAWALGLRISMRHEQAVESLLNSRRDGNLFAVTRRVLIVTFATEGLGAAILLSAFLARGEAAGSAAFRALFTSISAFCNAGFALQTASLIPYQQDPLVLYTIAGLIILGGLSPTVICAVPRLIHRRRTAAAISLQTRLILVMSACLLALGFLLYLALEWNHSLSNLAPWDRIHNAFFQAVTFRTAGFNSVDLTLMAPATISLSLGLMFVGGSPGGTAGGVKTTTIALLLLTISQAMNGHTSIQLFGRRVSAKSVHQAIVVTSVAALFFFLALSSIQLTQDISTKLAVFEVVSALGTVGLTLGATPLLDEVGKVLIAICMFVGRVGGMALLLLVAQQRTPYTLQRPEEDVDAG